jgi:hypothetical protein
LFGGGQFYKSKPTKELRKHALKMEPSKSQESSEEEAGCMAPLVLLQNSVWSWGMNMLAEFLRKPAQD